MSIGAPHDLYTREDVRQGWVRTLRRLHGAGAQARANELAASSSDPQMAEMWVAVAGMLGERDAALTVEAPANVVPFRRR